MVTGEPVDCEPEDAVFADSKGDEAMAKAYNLGILTGYNGAENRSDVRVGPSDPINREQAATLLARLSEVMDHPLSPAGDLPFTDDISSWAYDGVAKAYQAGIMNGTGAETFDASGSYSVEQGIITMYRMAGTVDPEM